MTDLPPFVPRVERGPSARAMLDAYAYSALLGPLETPKPIDADPEGSRILGCIRDLIDGAYERRLEPVTAVHLSPREARRASKRIKVMQHDASGFRDVPDWARWDAPPARRFLGMQIVEDESVPDGQIRAMRGGRVEDYRLDPVEAAAVSPRAPS